ncbi:Tolloid-like protein 1, partial [Elysia marginata]
YADHLQAEHLERFGRPTIQATIPTTLDVSGSSGLLLVPEFDCPSPTSGSSRVQVRDGSSSSSSLIGRLCGSYTPRPMVASGSAMYLEFYTDGSVTYRGFSASYYGVQDGPPTTPVWNPPTSPAWNTPTPPMWTPEPTPAGSIPSFSQCQAAVISCARQYWSTLTRSSSLCTDSWAVFLCVRYSCPNGRDIPAFSPP